MEIFYAHFTPVEFIFWNFFQFFADVERALKKHFKQSIDSGKFPNICFGSRGKRCSSGVSWHLKKECFHRENPKNLVKLQGFCFIKILLSKSILQRKKSFKTGNFIFLVKSCHDINMTSQAGFFCRKIFLIFKDIWMRPLPSPRFPKNSLC